MISKGIAGFNAGLARSVGNGYTPTEWATGDVITAEKLNNMETGIDENNDILSKIEHSLFVKISNYTDSTTIAVDKTYDEIVSAYENGYIIHAAFIRPGGTDYLYAFDININTENNKIEFTGGYYYPNYSGSSVYLKLRRIYVALNNNNEVTLQIEDITNTSTSTIVITP